MIHSGLQRKVLSLYRETLRIAKMKDRIGIGTPLSFISFSALLQNPNTLCFSARHKFRDTAKVYGKSEIDRIEHAIRQGKKWLKVMKMNGVSGFSFVESK